MVGSFTDILIAFISASIGVTTLAAGLMGWFLKKTNLLERIMLISAALLLIKPGIYTDLIGLTLLAFVIFFQKFLHPSE
jgi:TRAP-type uncharacterized transport system fused permease subunit